VAQVNPRFLICKIIIFCLLMLVFYCLSLKNIYMEMSQGNFLCSYLKQTKMSFFFSFTKLENRRAEQVLSREVGTSGRGLEVGKGWGRMNIVQVLCTHVCEWKNDTC
jgi:hypothetical protein